MIAKMVSETKRNLHHFFRFGSGVNGGLVGDTSLSRFEPRVVSFGEAISTVSLDEDADVDGEDVEVEGEDVEVEGEDVDVDGELAGSSSS